MPRSEPDHIRLWFEDKVEYQRRLFIECIKLPNPPMKYERRFMSSRDRSDPKTWPVIEFSEYTKIIIKALDIMLEKDMRIGKEFNETPYNLRTLEIISKAKSIFFFGYRIMAIKRDLSRIWRGEYDPF